MSTSTLRPRTPRSRSSRKHVAARSSRCRRAAATGSTSTSKASARLSSSPLSDGLFGGLFRRGPVAQQVSDAAWLQALLDVEAALARASARAGVVPAEAAEAIAAACRADRFDVDRIGAAALEAGNPVPALVAAIEEQLPPEAAAHVHRGATSQDVLDTASMLVARRALDPLVAELADAANVCAWLADEHRATVMAGRTLLQQAAPTTFGLKAAGWLVGLDESHALLERVRDETLAAQLGGDEGTLAALGDAGPEVVAGFADELGLREPTLPWHTVRVRPAVLASSVATAAGVLGKIARDVILLAQTEVAEAAEADGGTSSTLPQKRNPVRSVLVVAAVDRVPGLAATVLRAASAHEHERAAGAWHAEWEPLRDLLALTGSAASLVREALSGLRVDPDAMRDNLDDLLMAESVATALAGELGRPRAQSVVAAAARRATEDGRPFRDVLTDTPEVQRLGADALDAALSPEGYLGAANTFVDRALASRRA